MQVVSSSDVFSRVTGLRCLKIFLDDEPSWSMLKQNNYDQLVLTKLTKMLYNIDDTCLADILLDNLATIVKEQSTRPLDITSSKNIVTNVQTILNENRTACDIFLQLLDNIMMSNDKKLLLVHVLGLDKHILPLLGCCMFKYADKFTKTINMLLVETCIDVLSSFELLLSTLSLLNHFLLTINEEKFCLNSKICKSLLSNVFKVILKIKLDKLDETHTQQSDALILRAVRSIEFLKQTNSKVVNEACQDLSKSSTLCNYLNQLKTPNSNRLIQLISNT